MGEFFKPWRRKVGVVALVMALVFMFGWIRSEVMDDWIMININAIRTRVRVSSANSKVNVLRWTPEKGPHISYGFDKGLKDRNPLTGRRFQTAFDYWDEFKVERRFDWAGFHSGNGRHRSWHGQKQIAIWLIPYWSIVMPLTLLSAYLLLWPGKRPERTPRIVDAAIASNCGSS